MKINNEEINIEKLVSEINPRENMIKDRQNGIFLSDYQIELLKQYGFIYENYPNVKSLIFDLEDYLNENYIEELENIIDTLSEFE